MTAVLSAQGYDIDAVANGYEAIRQMNVKSYDLIITDYRMPIMDGLELTRKIKSEYPSMPVLIVTGIGPVQDLLKSGATACIMKPFGVLELKNLVQNILDKNALGTRKTS
jgi:CheY-like chemotaxis protein